MVGVYRTNSALCVVWAQVPGRQNRRALSARDTQHMTLSRPSRVSAGQICGSATKQSQEHCTDVFGTLLSK